MKSTGFVYLNHNFSFTKILREINYGFFRVSKSSYTNMRVYIKMPLFFLPSPIYDPRFPTPFSMCTPLKLQKIHICLLPITAKNWINDMNIHFPMIQGYRRVFPITKKSNIYLQSFIISHYITENKIIRDLSSFLIDL